MEREEEEDVGLPPSDKRKGSDNEKANGEGRTKKDACYHREVKMYHETHKT